MSSQTRNQEYRYQYKTVAVANSYFCGYGPALSVSVPENLLDIKAIFLHAVLRFNSAVPAGRRKILWVGGSYPVKFSGNTTIPDPINGNLVEVNVSADPSSRIADIKIDITHLKDGLLTALAEDTFSFDQPRMKLSIITDESNGFEVDGEVILWKVDFAYTTTGIQ